MGSQGDTEDRIALYANVGGDLTHYDVDFDRAELIRRDTIRLPANVQYAWQHASRRYLYAATGNREPGPAGSASYHLWALRIDPRTGALAIHGNPVELPYRAIHVTTDIPSEHVLVAYHKPSALTVHRINPDGTIGSTVEQPPGLDTGIFAHQIRIAATNDRAFLVSRGNDARGSNPEDPGAIRIFRYRDGVLADGISVAPHGGFGFGPRHLDFHPHRPWMYVSLERQNRLDMFSLDSGTPPRTPQYSRTTLAEPGNLRPRQLAGTLHVHPTGRWVYVANRADGTTPDIDGRKVFAGGENGIAVFAIDERTGEPAAIQHMDCRGSYPRCFTIDPAGRLLVAGNKSPILVKDQNGVREMKAGLSVFRMHEDGTLAYARNYEIDVGGEELYWVAMLPY